MQENLEITNTLALVIGGIIIVTIIILVGYIIHLAKRVKSLQTPKYGFLGKSIYPIMVVALLTGTLFFISNQEPEDVVNTEAQKHVEFDIVSNYIKTESDYTQIFLSLDIYTDSGAWDIGNDKVDIYWDIIGPTNVSRFEIGMSQENQSGYDIYLESGDYVVKAKVVYSGSEYEYSEEFIIE